MTKRKHADGERVYIVYDQRAASGDTDVAGMLEALAATTDHKAKQEAYSGWRDQPYVLYGNTFKDGVAVEDDAPLYKHLC